MILGVGERGKEQGGMDRRGGGGGNVHGFFRSWWSVDAFTCCVVWMSGHDDVAY